MYTAGPIVQFIFLIAVAVIWVMIIYQVLMTFAGYLYRRRTERQVHRLAAAPEGLPGVSVLIPARNEGLVIANTLDAILGMNYPKDKLEVIVLNDGSTDDTEAQVNLVSERDGRVRILNLPPGEKGHGKSYALNIAYREARHDLIAIYDADNRPEPDSLRFLVARLVNDPALGATFGKFRTINRDRNLLTRFIHVETLAFQWIIQAGRCRLFGVGVLPGTNFVIRRQVLEECSGWDEQAITEDAELSVRIYEKGWKIGFVPQAVTWEEEPERFRTWLRQRTRWVRGNFYVLRKFLARSWRFKNKFLALELLYLFLLYYFFLAAILSSHAIFVLCGTGVLRVNVPGPFFAVWVAAFVLFVVEVALALSYEEESSPVNIGVTVLMYFTYCQAWILIVFRALFVEYVLGQGSFWEKTERYGTKTERTG